MCVQIPLGGAGLCRRKRGSIPPARPTIRTSRGSPAISAAERVGSSGSVRSIPCRHWYLQLFRPGAREYVSLSYCLASQIRAGRRQVPAGERVKGTYGRYSRSAMALPSAWMTRRTSVCSNSRFDMKRMRRTTVPGGAPLTTSSSTRISPFNFESRRWITLACTRDHMSCDRVGRHAQQAAAGGATCLLHAQRETLHHRTLDHRFRIHALLLRCPLLR